MTKVKIFSAVNEEQLENQINEWLKSHPEILNTPQISFTCSGWGFHAIVIYKVYM